MSVVAAPDPVRRPVWPVAEERRTVTVLFVDIVGSTRLVDRLDPEDVRALQRAYFEAVAQVLRRWDGVVEKYVGDAVMALFGARCGDGWEAYKAVRAGLEIQDALDRRPLPCAPDLRVRVGVATGEALVDLPVSQQGGHGMASGAVITLAARLQEYAPPGGVAVCGTTRRAVAGLIAQRRAPAVTVTGKTLPVEVWHATGTLRPRPPQHDGPLLGRRRDLAVARERLAEAIRDRGVRRLLIVGPAGSGRSRLLRELARTTPTVDAVPVRWCRAACPPCPDGPLEPAADLVRGLVGARVTDDPDLVRRRLAADLDALVPADLLAPALDTVDDLSGAAGAAAGARAMTHWQAVLLSLARRQPVVLAVDDLDRAAPALRRHLDTLVDLADVSGLPLVLVATGTQDTGGPTRAAVRVPLSPLDPMTTGRLLRRLLRRAGRPAGLAARLIPLVGGVPGHAVAYVHSLDGGDPAQLPVPESIRRVVEARLDRLDGNRRAALMAVAALPPGCTVQELAMVLGWPAARAAAELAALTGSGLLVPLPPGGYDVRDPLVRHVAAARLPRAARAVLTRRAGAGTSATGARPGRLIRTCASGATPDADADRRPRRNPGCRPRHAGSAVSQERQDPVPGQLGGDRVVVGDGRVGEEVPCPRVAVNGEIGTGGGHLPLPLVDLLGWVVGVGIGQVQLDRQSTADGVRASAGAVQQQQAGGVGAVGQQRASHPGAHREPGEHGLGRQPVERRASAVENVLLADPVQQREPLLDGVDAGQAVKVGHMHPVPGGAQPVGGGQHGRSQPVDGMEEHDVSHRDIVPDAADSTGPARADPSGSVGSVVVAGGRAAPIRRTRFAAFGRSSRAQDAALPTKLRDHLPALAAHRDVVDAAAAVPGALGGPGDEYVALPGRADESDVGAGGDSGRAVTVAGQREGGVSQQEHEAAVRDAVTVDHAVGDPHPGHRGTTGGADQLDAQPVGRDVDVEHLVRGGALRVHLTPGAVSTGRRTLGRTSCHRRSERRGWIGVPIHPRPDHRSAIFSQLQDFGNKAGQGGRSVTSLFGMTPYITDAAAWQESWDRQQEAYLPDREHRFTAMLDAVDAVRESAPLRLLDLAGGTGTISLRALRRFPDAELTLVDLDPALLALAVASLGDRATIVTADLKQPDWHTTLPHRGYDAVLTATALHWLPADRLSTLYAELRDLLRPGGLLVNADYMPEDTLPELTKRLLARAEQRRAARYAAGATLSWSQWWDQAAQDPTLRPLVEQRHVIYPSGHSPEWNPPASWHLNALTEAGFREVGTLWRGGADAAVVALR
ncbi:hypothetical protein Xph01_13210 [Micromonospora phaseoli]|nr:hypothetical protein Xph01_13210 [Micromonospora phaseoli]